MYASAGEDGAESWDILDVEQWGLESTGPDDSGRVWVPWDLDHRLHAAVVHEKVEKWLEAQTPAQRSSSSSSSSPSPSQKSDDGLPDTVAQTNIALPLQRLPYYPVDFNGIDHSEDTEEWERFRQDIRSKFTHTHTHILTAIPLRAPC